MTVNVGDIFRSSWGYDQTNVDFFQVVGKTKSGQSVKLRRLSQQQVSQDSWASGKVVPVKDGFDPRYPEIITKRLQSGWNGKPVVKIYDFAYASLWDGQPAFYSEWH